MEEREVSAQDENPAPQEPPKEAQPIAKPIEVLSGALVPKDSSELNRTLSNIAAGGGFPARFDTPQKRIAAYNLAHSLMGESWQLALNNIANIKGQLSIYGELPGTLAERTGEVAEKYIKIYDREYREICLENKNLDSPLWAAVCFIQRKGREPQEFPYTMDDAEKAGQYPARRRDGSLNEDSPWMKFTRVMLMRKAMAMGIKFLFPEAMCGVPIAEYDFDSAPDLDGMKNVTPSQDDVEDLTKKIDELD